jgi:hypothetical protein
MINNSNCCLKWMRSWFNKETSFFKSLYLRNIKGKKANPVYPLGTKYLETIIILEHIKKVIEFTLSLLYYEENNPY